MIRGRPLLLKNARLIDPATGRDQPGNLLVGDGQILDLGPGLIGPEGADVIDCKGDVLAPGLIDMQAFIGEPGAEHRETLRTAGEAAAHGGVTTIVAMPTVAAVPNANGIATYLLNEPVVISVRRSSAGCRRSCDAMCMGWSHWSEVRV